MSGLHETAAAPMAAALVYPVARMVVGFVLLLAAIGVVRYGGRAGIWQRVFRHAAAVALTAAAAVQLYDGTMQIGRIITQ